VFNWPSCEVSINFIPCLAYAFHLSSLSDNSFPNIVGKVGKFIKSPTVPEEAIKESL
jgi:hypothetical protein